MNQTEWAACTDPDALLQVIRINKPSERKLRLVAAECCRRASHADKAIATAAFLAERMAEAPTSVSSSDRQNTRDGITAVRDKADKKGDRQLQQNCDMALAAIGDDAENAARLGANHVSPADKSVGASLLREVFRSPSAPPLARATFSSETHTSADAVYAGDTSALTLATLADCLSRDGHAELAEHFRAEQTHSKGCWALDFILGKQ